MAFENICVVGLGYIGLPTAAMFASKNKKVVGVDVNQQIVDTINKGKIHIVEPELDDLVKTAVANGFLSATTLPQPADAFLIAVPTPFKQSNSETPEPDLSYVESATKAIGKVIKAGDLIVLESTSPVGTTENVSKWLAELRPDLALPLHEGEACDINIAYCPERVLPGQIVKELVTNDRVIGGITEKCASRAIELYKIFVQGECITTNSRTAEMVKLTENASRDVQIAFANELSMICDEIDVDVWELIKLANRHPRVNILQPGPGVGGHCIAVDPWFIVSRTPRSAKLIRTARHVNDSKTQWVVNKIDNAIEKCLLDDSNKAKVDLKIALLGLSFKPNIDDLRHSPAVEITFQVARTHPVQIIIVEPNIEQLPTSIDKLAVLRHHEIPLDDCDIVTLLVDHDEFKCIDPLDNESDLPIVIDTRGVWLI